MMPTLVSNARTASKAMSIIHAGNGNLGVC